MFDRTTAFLLTALTLSCLFHSSVQKFKVTKDMYKMAAASKVITMRISDAHCKTLEEGKKMISVEEIKEHMYGVTEDEIEVLQEKIFYIYNNFRKDSETDKLYKVKQKVLKLHPDHKWSAVVIMGVAHSMAFHKFFTFQVKCKYVIGLAGIKCK